MLPVISFFFVGKTIYHFSSLFPLFNCASWKVCVRLEKKFSITNYTNKKNGREGKFCTFEFVDTAGTHMNGQAYDDICEKYHEELDVGKVYCISGFHNIKMFCFSL